MDQLLWIALGTPGYLAAILVLGVIIGKAIRLRDNQVPRDNPEPSDPPSNP